MRHKLAIFENKSQNSEKVRIAKIKLASLGEKRIARYKQNCKMQTRNCEEKKSEFSRKSEFSTQNCEK